VQESRTPTIVAVLIVLCALIGPPAATAQQTNNGIRTPDALHPGASAGFQYHGPQGAAPEAFGSDLQFTVFHASRFLPWDGHVIPKYSGSGYVSPSSAEGDYWAQIDLPNGAAIGYAYAVLYDASTTGYWYFDLHGYEGAFPEGGSTTPSYTSFADASTGISDAPGYVILPVYPSPPVVVREWTDMNGDSVESTVSYNLSLEAYDSDGAGDLRFWGVAVRWTRTISPAPASATFADVPTDHWAFQFVEALVDAGITAGCGGGNYCPDDPITRGQMAVYLAAALGLHWPI